MNWYDKEWIKKQLNKDDKMYITNITIPRRVIYNIDKNMKHRIIPPLLLHTLQQSIQLIPLWGGGMDSNGEYDVIVVFRNSPSLKTQWKEVFGGDSNLEVVWLDNDIERWLYQKQYYFGWSGKG